MKKIKKTLLMLAAIIALTVMFAGLIALSCKGNTSVLVVTTIRVGDIIFYLMLDWLIKNIFKQK